MKSDDAIYVSMPGIPSEIPLIVLMRALGLESDKEIAEAVSPKKIIQNQLESSFEKAIGIDTMMDAILYIGNRVAHGQGKEYRLERAQNWFEALQLVSSTVNPTVKLQIVTNTGHVINHQLLQHAINFIIENDR